MKPETWKDPSSKLFPYQVGLTASPHDFDAAATDFLRIAPETVGVHGRMLHVPAALRAVVCVSIRRSLD